MSVCAACGRELGASESEFCGGCGTSLTSPDKRLCKGCKAVLSPRAKFCGGCGRAVREAPPQRPMSKVVPDRSNAQATIGVSTVSGTFEAVSKAVGPVLYVAPRAQRPFLEPILRGSVAGPNRGNAVWVEAETALETVQAILRNDSVRGLEAICIIGSHDEIPLCKVDDPCGYDEALYTDAFFGMKSTPTFEERFADLTSLLPEVPVSRIPSTRGELVSRLLHAGRRLHRSWRTGLAVSAKVWARATREVIESLAADLPVLLSPPTERIAALHAMGSECGRLLFNCHGTDQDTVWLGEGDGSYPELLRPEDIAVASNAIVASEACYGAYPIEAGPSIANAFLEAGASAFFGSTIIAWGAGPGHPPCLADLLAGGVFKHLDDGLPAAYALHQAKLELIEQNANGGFWEPLHNTLLSFVHLGAPLCTARSRTASQSTSQLQQVREQLRQRLGEDAWATVASGRERLDTLRHGQANTESVFTHLEALLGTLPESVELRRTRGASGEERRSFLLSSKSTPFARCAAVELGADGTVTRLAVSKGAREASESP
ncbi:MAG: hypothetical protein CO108_28255 [Deltaproteobacteria bacterium CG_4_9_14_3_um_filter_63_12]|nr:MAG: hypothetical protein CO108_28255 [Deltaproteobacteria bacterium CG_4_9_14_3_um_filter_63_12]